jgi:hypothetical protein
MGGHRGCPPGPTRAAGWVCPRRFAVAGEGQLFEDTRRDAPADVVLLGWGDDVATVYAAAGAVLLTSENEEMPASLVEAAMCGTPAVSTDVGSAHEGRDRPGRPAARPRWLPRCAGCSHRTCARRRSGRRRRAAGAADGPGARRAVWTMVAQKPLEGVPVRGPSLPPARRVARRRDPRPRGTAGARPGSTRCQAPYMVPLSAASSAPTGRSRCTRPNPLRRRRQAQSPLRCHPARGPRPSFVVRRDQGPPAARPGSGAPGPAGGPARRRGLGRLHGVAEHRTRVARVIVRMNVGGSAALDPDALALPRAGC